MSRTAIVSTATRFVQLPPEPDAVVTTATLAVAWTAGPQSYTLTPRAADTVTAISDDRTRLTLTWGSGGQLTSFSAGQPEPAWLSYGAQAQIPVRVARLVSTSTLSGVVELAEALPLNANPGGTLNWLALSATIPGGHVPATPQDVKWTLTYTPVRNGLAGTARTVQGTLSVVRAAFSTGLTHGELVESSPWCLQFLPEGQTSFAPQIQAAERTLRGRIKALLEAGQSVDLVAGEQFKNAHALETRLRILRGLQEAGQDRTQQIEDLKTDLDEELERIFAGGLDWIDSNGDGALTADETDQQPARLRLLAFTQRSDLLDTSTADAEPRPAFRRRRVGESR